MSPPTNQDEIRAWNLAESSLHGRYWTCRNMLMSLFLGIMMGALTGSLITLILR